LGRLSATFFDRIVIKEDRELRGRDRGEVAELIVKGIAQANTEADAPVPHSIELDEAEALEWALDQASDHTLVAIFADNVTQSISLIMSRNPIPDDPQPTVSAELNLDNLAIPEPLTASNHNNGAIPPILLTMPNS
jgi:cyanophycin synthetase